MKENEREKLKRQIKVMSEFLKGKKIERVYLGKKTDIEDKDWQEDVCPLWDWFDYNYRVKKELQYRAYTLLEFLEASKKHGPYVYFKTSTEVLHLPVKSDYKGIYLAPNCLLTYDSLCETLCWADGSPFGIFINN